MTKKEAAARAFFVAQSIRKRMGDDEDAAVWIYMLEYLAVDLDPKNLRYLHAAAEELRPSVRSKLRRLIEHPTTPPGERDAAILALNRLDAKDASTQDTSPK